tara:strand:+ start:1592 stop:1792 length:201 start_codon:yes stop_codon:yes gene_type:complete
MDMTFKEWRLACDKLVASIVGMGIDCLPDANWMDMYNDGMSPADAIDDAYYDYWSDDIPEEVWYGE